MTVRFLILATMVLLANPALGSTTRCEIIDKHYCENAGGCKSVAPKVWNVVDFGRETYSRCDSQGCDEYPAQISQSGTFTIVDIPGRGTFAKLSADGASFVEVATLGTDVYVSFGRCSPIGTD